MSSAASSLLLPPRASRRHRASTALAPYLASRHHRWAAATLAVAALASVLGTTAYYYYLHSSSSSSSSSSSTSTPPAPTPGPTTLPNQQHQPPQTSINESTAAPGLANTVVAAARSLFSGSSVVVTISMKNIIVWNPSPDPATPNHAFRESALPYLQSLVKSQNPRIQIHLITVVSSDEEEAQIRELLKASGLYADGLDERRVLFCGTEEGKAHLVRHIEPAVHVDQNDEVIERLAPYVKRLVRVRRTVIGSPRLGGVGAAPAAARTASAPGSTTTVAASSARASHESLQLQHHDVLHAHPHPVHHNPLLSHHLHHHPPTPSPLATSRRSSSAAGGPPSSNASSASLARTPTLTKLDGIPNDPTSSETLYRPATPSPPNSSNIIIPAQQSSPPHPSPLALHARHPSSSSAKDVLLTAGEAGGGLQTHAEGDSPAQRLARRFPNVEFVECFAQARIETPYTRA
ncbi:hypothetical protein HDU87_003986 [Geranomyces variabilis]|uniref:Peroxisome assembly protein 22 n=1 Tax=Geranomyces variabilis TaxID=109894 RepID=A0AAD5TQY8_9FUNG|nr:hypothetical protein HDU87_003986 [Geranomyces variabilis]